MICNGRAARGTACGARRASARARASSAREARYSSFKLWLKYAKPSRGEVIVDRAPRAALREGSRQPAAGRRERGAGASSTRAMPWRSSSETGRRARAEARGEGHQQLLLRGAAPGAGPQVGGGSGVDAARERGGGPPRLPRGGLRVVPCRGHGDGRLTRQRHLPRGQARLARAGALGHDDQGRRARGDRGALEGRAEEILAANERDMEAGRERSSATRCSTACAWTTGALSRSRGRSGRSRRSPTRSAR